MLASDRSATERWGAAQQFGASANKPGLRQPYLGYLKNMALLYNNSAIVSKGWESDYSCELKYKSLTNIVLIYEAETCNAHGQQPCLRECLL